VRQLQLHSRRKVSSCQRPAPFWIEGWFFFSRARQPWRSRGRAKRKKVPFPDTLWFDARAHRVQRLISLLERRLRGPFSSSPSWAALCVCACAGQTMRGSRVERFFFMSRRCRRLAACIRLLLVALKFRLAISSRSAALELRRNARFLGACFSFRPLHTWHEKQRFLAAP
jgi:hypothetical protein